MRHQLLKSGATFAQAKNVTLLADRFRVESAITGQPPHRSVRDQFLSRLGTPRALG